MKELGAREFRTAWTGLTGEVVRVTSRGRTLGHWVPGDSLEVLMEEPVKKAIEPDQAKSDSRGKLSKGLGEVPGRRVDPAMNEAWARSQPSPKKDK